MCYSEKLVFVIEMLIGSHAFSQSVGIGNVQFVPSGTLEIRGVSILNTDYALKVRDNTSADLLVVQNDGNVGIGISSPLYKFVVNGNAEIMSHGSVGSLAFPSSAIILQVHDYFAGGANATGIFLQPMFQDFVTPLTDLFGLYAAPEGVMGTITNVTGVKSIPSGGACTVSNIYCFYAQNPVTANTIASAYGLYLENITPGTTNFSIYSAGGKCYFAGNIGLGTTSPNSTLNVNGSFSTKLVSKTSDYTISATDYTILANANAGGFTITLPTAVGIIARIIVIKKIDASANVVVVNTTAAQTIDGAAPPLNISVPNDRIIVQSDGINWVRID